MLPGVLKDPKSHPKRSDTHEASMGRLYIYLHENQKKSTIHVSANIQSSHGWYGVYTLASPTGTLVILVVTQKVGQVITYT